MSNSEETRVGYKLGITDGEVTGIKLKFADIIKIGGDEGSGLVLPGVYCEGERDINFEDRSEEIEKSAL